LMPGADGSTVWADGFRSADGAAIDAKNVRQLGCSARTLDRLQQQDRYTSAIQFPKDYNEFGRYRQAINNPANHVQFLEVDTNDPQTMGYWQFICAEQHVKSDV